MSDRPVAERIPLAELKVVHDPRTDLTHLFSARLQARVVPVHLGMLADVALPPAMRFADRAFGTAWTTHSSRPPLISWEEWPFPAGRRATADGQAGIATLGEILRRPRVEAGHVVLQRARWSVPAERLPARTSGEPDAGFLPRLTAWLRQQAVPGRTFVRGWAHGDVSGKALQAFKESKAFKPVYLDVANPWLVAEFERQVDACDFVVFEEALPDPGEALGPDPGEARVTEFLIEITDGEGGHG